MSWRLTSPKTLKACWLLRNNALEEMNGYDGTWSGTESYTDGSYGHSVADFNGSSYINCGSDSSLEVEDKDFTISVLIKTSETANKRIVAKRAGVNNYYTLQTFNNGENIKIVLDDGPHRPTVIGTVTINDNSWHHVVGVRDAGNIIYVYVDGALDNSASDTTGDLGTDGVDFTISDDAGQFNGQIGNVRIYNVALTGDEVITLNRMDKRI